MNGADSTIIVHLGATYSAAKPLGAGGRDSAGRMAQQNKTLMCREMPLPAPPTGSSVQFSRSVVSDCDPMDCSTEGFPVHH